MLRRSALSPLIYQLQSRGGSELDTCTIDRYREAHRVRTLQLPTPRNTELALDTRAEYLSGSFV